MHPGSCSLTPEEAPQNKRLLKQHTELLGHCSFGGDILCCRKTVDRTAGLPRNPHLLGWRRTQVVVFCGHSLCDKLNWVADLPRSSESRTAPGQGTSEELRVTPVLAVPSLMHPTASEPMGRAWCWSQGPPTVLDAAKGQTRSRV